MASRAFGWNLQESSQADEGEQEAPSLPEVRYTGVRGQQGGYKGRAGQEMREALEKMANDGDALREGTMIVRPPQTECAKDDVEHPSHYTSGGIECIDAMKAMLAGYEQAKIATKFYWHFLSGQVLKYLWRWPLKERPLQDLKKARWYLGQLIDDIEKQDEHFGRKETME